MLAAKGLRWLTSSLTLATLACTTLPEERCDAICDCTHCNDTEREVCLVDTTTERDIAAAYDCDGPYEALISCELTRSRCRDDRFFLDGVDCAAERAKLTECQARGSAL